MNRISVVLLTAWTALAQPVPSTPRPAAAAHPTSVSARPRTSSSAPLSDAMLAAAIAYTKLLGYVQYFHPSDQAQSVSNNFSWNDFAIQGMSQVLAANPTTPAALASTLQSIFQPLAPTVQVFPTGQQPPLPSVLTPASTNGLSFAQMYNFGPPGNSSGFYESGRVIAPLVNGALPQTIPDPHVNVGFQLLSNGLPAGWYQGGNTTGNDVYVYSMDSANPYAAAPSLSIAYSGTSTSEFGAFSQNAPTNGIQGTTITITVAIKTQNVSGYAGLYMEAYAPSGPVFQSLANAPQGTTGWQTYQVSVQVPPDATGLSFGVLLSGSGSAWFGGITLSEPLGVSYPVQNPAAPYVADLGGGVSCSVPLAVYANSLGTLPAATNPTIPSLAPYSVTDQATRMAAIAIIWNAIQHFQPYFNVVPDNWPAALSTAMSAAASAPDEPTFFNTLRNMTSALHDGHASFVYRATEDTIYGPPLVWAWIEGQLVVTYVWNNQGQQIAPGDVVVSIDGVPTTQALAQAESVVSGATRQWVRYYAVTAELGTGLRNSTATLVLNTARKLHTVTMQRVTPWDSLQPILEPRPTNVATLAPGIMYVNLGSVTDAQWDNAVNSLATAQGIIFDLRGYPTIDWNRIFQHLITQPISSQIFLVPVNAAPDQTQKYMYSYDPWFIVPAAPFFPAKIVWLTDGRAISQAEVDMGLADYYQLGDIVGGPTAGTNGQITTFNLLGLYQVTFTGEVVLRQDGSQHHGVGVQPTIPVMRTIAGVTAGTDEILQRALQLLQNPTSRPIGPWVASNADGLADTASPGSLINVTVSPSLIGLGESGFSGASVFFDGHPAPVLTSPDTIVTVLPTAVAGQSSSEMTVQQNGQTVFSFGVQVSPVAPAAYSVSGTGRGSGSILNADGSLNAANNPALAGTTVSLYVTGLGLNHTTTVQVMVAGQPAQTATATVVDPNGAASLYLVQFTIPTGTPAGADDVFVIDNGVASQSGLLLNVQ